MTHYNVRQSEVNAEEWERQVKVISRKSTGWIEEKLTGN